MPAALGASGVYNISGVYVADIDDFLPRTDSDATLFRFKRNSRLLVLMGATNEDYSKEGAFYSCIRLPLREIRA